MYNQIASYLFFYYNYKPLNRSANPDNGLSNDTDENCIRVNTGVRMRVVGNWKDVPCLTPKGPIDGTLCQKDAQGSAGEYRLVVRTRTITFEPPHCFNIKSDMTFCMQTILCNMCGHLIKR
jgi:hypothetical protein